MGPKTAIGPPFPAVTQTPADIATHTPSSDDVTSLHAGPH